MQAVKQVVKVFNCLKNTHLPLVSGRIDRAKRFG